MQDFDDWLISREKSIEYKKQANTDTTYCNNKNCIDKCWRYINNYKFDDNENYWVMSICDKELKRIEELFGVKEYKWKKNGEI